MKMLMLVSDPQKHTGCLKKLGALSPYNPFGRKPRHAEKQTKEQAKN